jgi:hypothetical protein
MKPCEQNRTAWAISRLRTMPPERFYLTVVLLSRGSSVSSVARLLLAFPDRGGMQFATFHTLRTYLTLLHQNLEARVADSSLPPDILMEASYWFRAQKSADSH